MASSDRRHVYLPPTLLSDFIVHFHDTDFHVHQLVLHHHSVYFRNLLQSFPSIDETIRSSLPLVEAGGDATTRSSLPLVEAEGDATSRSSFPLVEAGGLVCGHSPWVRCVNLPSQPGRLPVTEGDLLTFFHHLYFVSTFNYPPLTPPAHLVDLISADTPFCLYAAVTAGTGYTSSIRFLKSLDVIVGTRVDVLDTNQTWLEGEVIESNHLLCHIHYVGWAARWDEWIRYDSSRLAPLHSFTTQVASSVVIPSLCKELMSLFDYFRCEMLLARCDDVLLGDLRQRHKQNLLSIRALVEYMELADTYHLLKTEQCCLELIKSTCGTRREWRNGGWDYPRW